MCAFVWYKWTFVSKPKKNCSAWRSGRLASTFRVVIFCWCLFLEWCRISIMLRDEMATFVTSCLPTLNTLVSSTMQMNVLSNLCPIVFSFAQSILVLHLHWDWLLQHSPSTSIEAAASSMWTRWRFYWSKIVRAQFQAISQWSHQCAITEHPYCKKATVQKICCRKYEENQFYSNLVVIQSYSCLPFVCCVLSYFFVRAGKFMRLPQWCTCMSWDLLVCVRIAGHIQIGQVPGRHEPNYPGELDFSHLFSHIKSLGYTGWIGCEYVPTGKAMAKCCCR